MNSPSSFINSSVPGKNASANGLTRSCILAFGCLTLATASCSGADPQPSGPPVLLIVFDALAAKHVSHLGYHLDTTPHLDALAAEGATFEQALAPAPYTLASIPSILTGRLPDTHGLVDSHRTLPEGERTLAEQMAGRGYRTFGAVANLNGSSLYGLGQGFERYLEMYRPEGERQLNYSDDEGTPKERMDALRKNRAKLTYPKAEEYVPVLTDWMASLKPAEVPFYYLHILEPHSPYQPPQEYRDRFVAAGYDGPFKDGDSETLLDALNERVDYGVDDEDAARALYDANLAYGDAQLGKLLDLLKADGSYDETLIVVTSDHGEAFWEHGQWGHNFQLYEEMVRVPLVVKFPKDWQRTPVRSKALVSNIDIVPSLCEWADLSLPKALDGQSLERSLDAANSENTRGVFLRTHHSQPDYGLRTENSKLLFMRNGPGRGSKQLQPLSVQGFDMQSDPSEFAPQKAKQMTGGEALLGQLKGLIKIQESRLAASANEGSAPDLSEQEMELLKGLGYLGDEGD